MSPYGSGVSSLHTHYVLFSFNSIPVLHSITQNMPSTLWVGVNAVHAVALETHYYVSNTYNFSP